MRRTVRAVSNTVHTVFRQLPVTGMNIADGRFMRLYPWHLFAVFGGAHQQMRNLHDTVINQDHQCLTHLDWGRCPVTLTDTNRNGVTLIPRFFKAFLFPFAGRHVAGTFFRQVDTGVMTITEFPHPFGEAIDPHIVGHLIEEGIRRFFQRSCDIQTPVAPFFPVTITFFRPWQLPPAGVKQRRIARDHPGTQCRNRHIGFNCRRGRINPLCGAVHQRCIRVVQQGGIIFAGDTVNKQVWVITRRGNQRQHPTCTRIGDYHSCAATRQQRFNILLEFEIQRQVNIVSGLRWYFF